MNKIDLILKEIRKEERTRIIDEVLKILDYDWRDSCSRICAQTHPVKYNPHLVDARKLIKKLDDKS